MLWAILNKSWRQHPTRHQLYGHLPPITKTIPVRRTRHAGHCWRSKDELISDVLLWTPTYGRAKAGWPARTYIQQLCEDTGCSPEDLPEAMNDREKWWERVRDIHASGMMMMMMMIYVYIYARSISFIFSLCIESNALLKSTYNSVASKFFACIPLTTWPIVRICEVVHQFLQKLFWLFLDLYQYHVGYDWYAGKP